MSKGTKNGKPILKLADKKVHLNPQSKFISNQSDVQLPGFASVSISRVEFRTESFSQELYSLLGISFPHSLGTAVSKRKAEFLAGRYAAKTALTRLGITNTHIPIGSNRNPIWPEGTIGSITHTDSSAICAVAHDSNASGLGIDLEQWLPASTIESIASSIINNNEKVIAEEYPAGFDAAFSIMFSIKESLFKALYPSVGRYFDFLDAEVIDILPDKNQINIRLLDSLSTMLPKGREFKGDFYCEPDGVFTVIATD